MAMAPALYAPPAGTPGGDDSDYGFDVQVVPDGTDADVSGDESASAAQPPPPEKFDDNLAATMEDSTKKKLVMRLRHLFDTDKLARADWEEAAARGVEILGLKNDDRSEPWEGACGVHSTVLVEAVVRFGAQTIMELFPVSGPVEVRNIGVGTPVTEAAKRRVQEDLNMFLTRRMREYRSETERLLFHLPLCGSAFRKVYFDKRRNRPVSLFIPATDVVIPTDPTHLDWCPRIFHVQMTNAHDLDRRMATGELLDVELPTPSVTPSILNPLGDQVDKLMGYEPSVKADGEYQIIETMIDMVPEDFGDNPDLMADPRTSCPYLVTFDYDNEELLGIYRNWRQEEVGRNRRDHFILYTYLPGFGVYGIGLSHLIGGITEAATSLMRQLVDAGTLSNLPGGIKARGLRIKNDDTPIAPGEWRDVDVPGNALRDNIFPLPYKEPSQTLLALMTMLVEDGRRLGSVMDMQVGDFSSQAPVGTTMALLERGMKIMSSVQARLHASMTDELQLISELIRDNLPGPYEYAVEDGDTMPINRAQDYSMSLNIQPVSDPNSSSLAMRITQHQATLQLSAQNPGIYDQEYLHRCMLDVIGMKQPDKIIPKKPEMQPLDPVSENQAILRGQPVKAFSDQDHDSHMAVHMSAMQDPMIQKMIGQAPQAMVIQGAMVAHVGEHLAFTYRRKIEMALGAPLPPEGQPLPPNVEAQLSLLEAQAAKQVLEQSKSEAAQAAAQAALEDPVVQMQQRELDIKQAEVDRKSRDDSMRTLVDVAKLMSNSDNQFALIEERSAAADARTDTQIDTAQIRANATVDAARIKAAADVMRAVIPGMMGFNDGSNGPPGEGGAGASGKPPSGGSRKSE